jgi:myxalamid-type polyketide synthase MxaE and MxaD
MSELSENDGRRILLQNAIVKINEMQNKLIAAEEARHEPIAITGMACRFPGEANSPQEFWQLLKEGRDAIVEIPPERWPVDEYYDPDPTAAGKIATRWGGFLSQVDQFDAHFFGISPREAASMDPQQRLLLETTWEALEAAGEAPDQLAGSQTGVFVGLYSNDYEQLQFRSPATLGAYAGTGTSRNIAAGRLSYSLDLRGPSVALDTACSSSLLAVHLACQSLRARECHLALAAGVNLLLAPHFLIATSKMHMLAADGRCKTFDAAANGIVLSEGCGVVVLKRLSDALAAGDPILALIRGSAANQDGRSAALTAPNPLAQRDVIQQALSQAHLQPQDIGYIETHGTGTVLGDPIEYEALSAVFGSAPEAGPCYLGAVKTNIGHAGAASGMAGLIKAILVLRHKEIPPLLHLQTLNPAIHLDQSPFCIPTTCVPWEVPSQRYYAGVSSFGWSGTNVHVVLEEAPAFPAQEPVRADEPPPLWLLPISARSPHALRQFAHTCSSFLREQPPQALPALSFTACQRRSHHPYRFCLQGTSPDALAALALARAQATGELTPAGTPALLLVFAGQGCLWPGVARRLLRQEPVFAEQMERLEALLTPRTGWSLLHLLAHTPLDESARQLEETRVAQPVLFAVQVALARLLLHWGLRPAAVLGHSVGEIAAALIGGQLSEQEAADLVSERGRLMEAARGRGKLLAVGLARREVESLLVELEVEETEVGVACENAPRALVLWGTPAGLARVEQALRARQGQVSALPGAYPFHSPWLSEVQERLGSRLADLHPQAGSVPFFSSLWGRQIEGQALNASYWSRQVREPVRFAQAMQEVMRSFEQVAVLELGGRPVLQGAVRQCLQEAGGRGRVWPTLRAPQEEGEGEVDERACLLESVGGLYEQGVEPAWERVNRWPSSPPPPVVVWPAYPWQRQRFWLDVNAHVAAQTHKTQSEARPFLGHRLRSALKEIQFERILSASDPAFLRDHCLKGATDVPVVAPGAFFILMALSASSELFAAPVSILEDVYFQQALVLPDDRGQIVQFIANPQGPGQFTFQIASQGEQEQATWTLHTTGKLLCGQNASSDRMEQSERIAIQARCHEELDGPSFYTDFWRAGYHLGPAFRWIEHIWRRDGEAFCKMRLPQGQAEVYPYQLHPGLIDSCFQALCLSLPHGGIIHLVQEDMLYIPLSINRCHFYRQPAGQLWCHARLQEDRASQATRDERPEIFTGDLRLFDDVGQLVAEVEGLTLKRVNISRVLQKAIARIDTLLYELQWQRVARQSRAAEHTPGFWVILADKEGIGTALARYLRQQGERSILLFQGMISRNLLEDQWEIDPLHMEMLAQIIQPIQDQAGCCRGVVHLWSLDVDAPALWTETELEAVQHMGYRSALALVQTLAEIAWTQAPRLWLVTRDVWQVTPAEQPVGFVHAPLWGLGRVIANELPQFHCSRVDISRHMSSDTAREIFEEISAYESSDEVALRAEERYVARLIPSNALALPVDGQIHSGDVTRPGRFAVRSDGTYLITGGLGGLGLLLARWLVEQGARHLVLLARSAPSQQTSERLSTLTQAHTDLSIKIIQADVAQSAQMLDVFAQMKQDMPPLRGIIHAAGILDDGIILQQSWERFASVARAKIAGAWNIHTLTREEELDFLLFFSSAASLLGSPGQSNYAAANAFLDALAHYRRSLGLPALSINWGPWSDAGMAAMPELRARFAERGIASLEAQRGLQVLSALSACSPQPAQLAVLDFAPDTWCQFYPAAATSSLLASLVKKEPAGPETQAQERSLRDALLALAPGLPRKHWLEDYLRQEIAQVLLISPAEIDPDAPLGKLALDSLMSMEISSRLKAALGLVLPTTLLWNYPTVARLAAYLAQRLNIPLEAPGEARDGETGSVKTEVYGEFSQDSVDVTDMIEEIEQLSEEDVYRSFLD